MNPYRGPVKLSALAVHPVKSTAIRPVQQAYVDLAGLRGDREWMVVDRDGALVSARELPSLFRICSDTPATDDTVESGLRLSAPSLEPLTVKIPDAQRIPVRVHRTELEAVPAGAAAHDWIRRALGRDDVRLVWCDDPTRRRLNPAWAREPDHTAFADSSPLTLASTRSLAQVQEWMVQTALERGDEAPGALPMKRFRPNLVVDEVPEPFLEDSWSTVRVGEVGFRVAAPVDRCVMTTIDPGTQAKGKEPIRTLARHRAWSGKTWFAVKLVPETTGTLRVGDEVHAG